MRSTSWRAKITSSAPRTMRCMLRPTVWLRCSRSVSTPATAEGATTVRPTTRTAMSTGRDPWTTKNGALRPRTSSSGWATAKFQATTTARADATHPGASDERSRISALGRAAGASSDDERLFTPRGAPAVTPPPSRYPHDQPERVRRWPATRRCWPPSGGPSTPRARGAGAPPWGTPSGPRPPRS